MSSSLAVKDHALIDKIVAERALDAHEMVTVVAAFDASTMEVNKHRETFAFRKINIKLLRGIFKFSVRNINKASRFKSLTSFKIALFITNFKVSITDLQYYNYHL